MKLHDICDSRASLKDIVMVAITGYGAESGDE